MLATRIGSGRKDNNLVMPQVPDLIATMKSGGVWPMADTLKTKRSVKDAVTRFLALFKSVPSSENTKAIRSAISSKLISSKVIVEIGMKKLRDHGIGVDELIRQFGYLPAPLAKEFLESFQASDTGSLKHLLKSPRLYNIIALALDDQAKRHLARAILDLMADSEISSCSMDWFEYFVVALGSNDEFSQKSLEVLSSKVQVEGQFEEILELIQRQTHSKKPSDSPFSLDTIYL